MSTRMTDVDRTTTDPVVERRPRLWHWALLAGVIALALWWAASSQRTANDTMYGNSTTPYNATPGIGGGNSGAYGGAGAPGTGDVGGVGSPSPSPTTPAPRGVGAP